MASWSAFGLGGFDPIGSLAEGILGGELNSYYTRKMADYNAALGYEYAEKYAKNNPSWQRQGIEAAGYNPLLAVSSGIASPFGGNVSGAISNVMGNPSQGFFDASAFAKDKGSFKVGKAENEAAVAEANAAKAAAELDEEMDRLRLDALRDMEYPEADSPTKLDFKQAYKNGIQRDRYVNSREHAIAEDAVNAIHGGSSAFSNIAHGMRTLREYSRRKKW